MNILPGDILNIVFSYDNTYRIKFKIVIDQLKLRNRNINNIKSKRLLISYNTYYIYLYKKRIKYYSPVLHDNINIFYKEIFNIVMQEILFDRDYSMNKLSSLWTELWKISKKCWKKSHIEYLKLRKGNSIDYYYNFLRNNNVLNNTL